MNWSILLEKLNVKAANSASGISGSFNLDCLPLKQKLPIDGSHSYDEMMSATSSTWVGTPAEDPYGLSSPSYQREEFMLEDEEDPEGDEKIFEYLDWYWRNYEKRNPNTKQPVEKPSNYNRDQFFANVHATLASNCTPRMYDGLRDPKTYPLESPRQYSKTVQVQNYQQNLYGSPKARITQVSIRHPREHVYDTGYGNSFSGSYMERRLHPPSPGLNGQHKTENWFRQRKFMEKELNSPTKFIDFEVPYLTDQEISRYLTPISEEARELRYRQAGYGSYRESPTTTTSKSDSNLMTPKRRYRQKESAY